LKLQNNQIVKLPDSIVQLGHLETLQLQNNQIAAFPSSVNKLTTNAPNLWSLFELDLSRNKLVVLPYGIGFLPEVMVQKLLL
jgi:leucine-rich repeat protein SHOC2